MKGIVYSALAVVLVIGSTGTSWAGDVAFTATGVFQDGATLSGTLTIDPVAGTVDGAVCS